MVELGPGTGPITQALLRRGVAPERLLLVEFDAAFCRLLRKRFPGVQVVQGDAYRLRESLAGVLREPAAAVVSSLPLLTKPDDQRLSLLEDAFSLMASNGCFVQFTYGMNSPIPRRSVPDYAADVSAPVWLNLPPARVWVYRRSAEAGAEGLLPDTRLAVPPDLAARESARVRAAKATFRPARETRLSLFHRVASRARQSRP